MDLIYNISSELSIKKFVKIAIRVDSEYGIWL